MAIFNFVRQGSGAPIIYGGATISVEKPLVSNSHYAERGFTYIPASGSNSQYFAVLENRFKVDPTGWSA